MEANALPRFFKSAPVTSSFKEGQIDAGNGIIKGVVMCQVGEAKGHGVHLEQEFITDLIAYDNKHFKKSGIKARFGHPTFSDTTMGTQMGVFKNFRADGEKAIADLHLLDAANLSPKFPQMKDWMLKMSEERPDFVMSSIVFRAGGYYQRNEKNKKRHCWYYKETKDEEGNSYVKWVSSQDDLGNVYVEFGKEGEHFYTDLVESGAATDNLFSNQFNRDKFAIRAIEFVKENPDIHKFLQENPEKLIEFSSKLGIELPKPSFTVPEKFNGLKEFLGINQIKVDPAELSQKEEQIKSLKSKLAVMKKELEAEQEANAQEVEEFEGRIEELETEVEELKAKTPPPTEFIPGEKNKGGTTTENYCSATQKEIDYYEAQQARKAAKS